MTVNVTATTEVCGVSAAKDGARVFEPDLLLWRDARGVERSFLSTDDIGTRDLARGTSWVVPSRHHGQPSRTGDYYFTSVGKHIAYASLVEYTLLLLLDHEATVAAILSQPFLMKFNRKGARLRHLPDYYVRRTNGHEEVWDVRPYSRIDGRLKEAAALTREFCWTADLDYHLYDGVDMVVRRNLEWLHAYSHDRYAPADNRVTSRLLGFFAVEHSIQDALEEFDVPQSELRSWIYNLLWRRDIVTDLSRPLSSHSPMTRAEVEQ